VDGEGEDDNDIMSSYRPAAVGRRTQSGTQPTTSANECTPAQMSTDEGGTSMNEGTQPTTSANECTPAQTSTDEDGTGTNEGSQVSSASPSTTPPSTPY